MMAHIFRSLTPMGDAYIKTLGSWLRSGPVLAFVSIWEVKQEVEDLIISDSLFLSNKMNI